MHALVAVLVPVIIVVAVGLIIWYVAERFSPDPLITKIVQIVVFAVVLIVLLLKLVPLLGVGQALRSGILGGSATTVGTD